MRRMLLIFIVCACGFMYLGGCNETFDTSLLKEGVPIALHNQETLGGPLDNTTWDNVKPCSAFFNESKMYDEMFECVEKNTKESLADAKPLKLPRCFVISASSPDIKNVNNEYNALILVQDGKASPVVGLYFNSHTELWLVENVDIRLLYKHELLHHFLRLLDVNGHGDGKHESELWKTCSIQKFTPSQEQILIHQINRFIKEGKSITPITK